MPKNMNNRNKNQGKGRKNYRPKRGDKSRTMEIEAKDEVGEERSNDPNWYFLDPKIAELASRFSFNQYAGVPFSVAPDADESKYLITVPNAAVIFLNPSVGFVPETFPQRAGINMAALRSFTEYSSKNGKTTQYAPQDMATLIAAMGDLLAYIGYIKRFFALAFTYNQRNRSFPIEVLRILGIDAESFIANVADLRLEFNAILTEVNKIPFPVNIPYFAKCADLYTHVNLDDETPMAQLVFLAPYSHWVFDEAYSDNGSGLRTVVDNFHSQNTVQFSVLLERLRNMVEPLLSSATLNYIYSDVLNIANKEGTQLVAVPLLEEGYTVSIGQDRTFDLQMHNGIAIGAPLDTADAAHTPGNDVVPDANHNSIIYRPQFSNIKPIVSIDKIVDVPTEEADLGTRIDATRYMVTGHEELVDSKYVTSRISLPDHYIVKVRVESFSVTTGGSARFEYTSGDLQAQSADNAAWILANIAKFNNIPRAYIFRSDSANVIMGVTGDMRFYTALDDLYLSRVNDLIYFGLFSMR